MKYFTSKEILSAASLLFISISLYFHKIILNTAWLWEDFTEFHFPMKYYILNSLKNGAFSFWNPYIFSGVPTAADIQIGLFYPLNLLMVAFSKMDAGYMYWLMEMQVIFHLFLSGLFMYFLMRYLKVSHFGSLFSAIAFSLLPALTSHLRHINMIQGFIWLPLIFLFFHKALHKENIKYSIFAGFFMGISILAAHPQIDYLIFLFIFSYLIYHLLTEKNISLRPFYINKIAIKKFSFFLIFIILSLGIAAIEILPYYEILNFSNRSASTSFAFASSFSLPPIQFIITSFLPHFYGGQNETAPYIGLWYYWELTNYLGIITLFLTIAGFIFLRKNKFIKFLAIFSLISLTMAFGYTFFTYYAAYLFIPGTQYFRAPARFLLLYGFSMNIIAGFALNFILDKNNFDAIKLFLFNRRKKIKILFYSIVFFLTAAALGAFYIDHSLPEIISKNTDQSFFISTIFNDLFRLTLLLLSAFIIFKKYFRQSLSLKNFKIAIILLLIIDLFWFGFDFNNSRGNPKDLFQKSREIEYLEKMDPNNFRLIDKSNKIKNTPLIYRIKSIDGYTGPAESKRYKDFIGEGAFDPISSFYPFLTSSAHRLELLNVCYILSNEIPSDQKEKYKKIDDLNLYKSNDCPNQAFIAHETIIENNPGAILSLIDKKDFNPRQEIILEKNPDLTLPNDTNVIYNDKVEIIKNEPDQIEIAAESKENGILFSSELYYPGWEAYIDGSQTEIYQADYVFRAIKFPKGSHTIKFTYNPKIFKAGAIISIISLFCIIISLLYLSITKQIAHNQYKI